jgi:hypothetical protein
MTAHAMCGAEDIVAILTALLSAAQRRLSSSVDYVNSVIFVPGHTGVVHGLASEPPPHLSGWHERITAPINHRRAHVCPALLLLSCCSPPLTCRGSLGRCQS